MGPAPAPEPLVNHFHDGMRPGCFTPARQPVSAQFLDLLRRAANHARYLSFRKLANIALVNVQAMLKTEYVVGRPYEIRIDPTNICNSNCQLCPTGRQLEGRPKGHMSYEDYTRLIDEFGPWVYTLGLYNWGDPFVSKDIFRFIDYAHRAGIWTHVSSNLHAFQPSQGHCEALIESGLNSLICSLHGASQDTFAIYQPGKSFDSVIAKIRRLQAAKAALKSRTPRVSIHFVLTRKNEHEESEFARLAAGLGCDFVVSQASLNVRFAKKEELESLWSWLPSRAEHQRGIYQQDIDWRQPAGDYDGRKLFPCSWVWKRMVVNWDCSVSACCGSWHTEDDLGSLRTSSFTELWNGPKYRASRRSFKKRTGVKTLCSTCPGTAP